MDWIFTFGLGSKLAHRCVRLHGTLAETRKRMFDTFGSAWAFQYRYEDWLDVQRAVRKVGLVGETEIPFDEAVSIFNYQKGRG